MAGPVSCPAWWGALLVSALSLVPVFYCLVGQGWHQGPGARSLHWLRGRILQPVLLWEGKCPLRIPEGDPWLDPHSPADA